jgi:DnaD/phage-associated family protein
MIGASDDDCKLLLMKRFLIAFESGVVVIKHWKIHNYIRNDRYKPTIYREEKALLEEKANKGYTEKKELGIPNGYQMDTQVRLGKDSIGKDNNNVSENELSTGYDEQLSTVLGKIIKEKWKRTPTENEISLAIQLVGELNGQVSMLADALDIAAQYGARAKNWKYVRSIVDSWVAKGYKTEEDVLMHELNRKGVV